MNRIFLSTGIVALTVFARAPVALAQLPTAKTVVLSTHSPGFEPNSLGGKMDATGSVTFSARRAGAPSGEDSGLYRAGVGGSHVLIMQEGDPAPGISGAFMTGPSSYQPLTTPLYLIGLTGAVDTTNNFALVRGTQVIARKGDEAPGTPEGVYWSYGTVPLRAQNSGIIAFGQFLTGSGVDSSNDEGIWMGSGSVSLVVREGDSLPGGGVANNLFSSNIANPGLNQLGMLAFRAQYDSTDSGIWITNGGAPQRIAGTGDIVPGHSTTIVLGAIPDDPALSQQGLVAFRGFEAISYDEGLWAGNQSTLRLIAFKNDAPPGAGGATIRSFGNPTIAGNFVAFKCFFWTTDEGIYRESLAGGLKLVAMTGQQPPGAPTGAEFLTFGHPTVNSSGQVVFQARMTGPPIGTSNQDGVWMLDRSGQLQAVALQGENLEIGPGDTRQLTSIGFNGGYLSNIGQGNGLNFNDRGQVLLYASFSDGADGLLMSTPEPLLVFEGDFESGGFDGWTTQP